MELPEGTLPSHWKNHICTDTELFRALPLYPPPTHTHRDFSTQEFRNLHMCTSQSTHASVHGHVHTSAKVFRDVQVNTGLCIQTPMYRHEYRHPGCPRTRSHIWSPSHTHTAACTWVYTLYSACHADVSSDARRSHLLPLGEWMFSLAAFRWVPGSAQAWKRLRKSIFAAVNY